MPRGRPKKSTVQVTFRINFDYVEKLKLINPQLTTQTPEGRVKFRHGALGRYLERLIRTDLEQRADLAKIDLDLPHVDLNAIMDKDLTNDSNTES